MGCIFLITVFVFELQAQHLNFSSAICAYLSAEFKKKQTNNNHQPAILAQAITIFVLFICSFKSITETIHKIHNPQEKQFKCTSVEKY